MKQAKKRFGRGAVASLFCATVLAASLPALPAAASTLAGDVNLDGSVNLSDAVAMQQYLLQEHLCFRFVYRRWQHGRWTDSG